MSKKKNKRSIFSSLSSMLSSLFSFGPSQAQEDLETLLDDDVIISPSKQIALNFRENRLGIFGLFTFVLIFVVVFGSTSFKSYNAYEHESVLNNLPPNRKYLDVDKKLQGKNLKTISSGVSYSVALDEEGELYFWGVNPGKRQAVDAILEKVGNKKIKDVASGDKHVVVVTEDDEVFGAGEFSFGQTDLPIDLKNDLIGDPITKIAAGVQFSAIVTESGQVHAWGSTLPNNLDTIPERIQGRVKDIAVGPFNIITILDDGTLDFLGQAGTDIVDIPEELRDGTHKVVDVKIANTTAIALDDQGNIHTWGSGRNGMQAVPEGLKFTSIAATRKAFAAVDESGKVHTWGSNKFNLTTLPEKLKSKEVKEVYGDYFQFYAVTEDNQVEGWGNKGFLLGTDHLGRDMFERLLQGGRVSLTVGAIAMIISTIIGVVVGLIAGFYGGLIDNLLMRFAEVISAFPFLPLAITLSAFLPPETGQSERLAMIMVILGVISWPGVARLVRGQILAEREKDFVLAARALGLKESTIIAKHILPSVFNFIIVSMTLGYASSLLTEAGLSFLGFGVVPPSPSWGNMLNGATNTTVIEYYWWQWVLPALCVMITALSVNLIGDALRDAMDPKSNGK